MKNDGLIVARIPGSPVDIPVVTLMRALGLESDKEIAKILRDKGFKKAPTLSVSLWVAKFLANFNKELKITVPYMGKIRSLSKSTKAKDILGWNPRPAEESILDVANQIKEMGLIK